MGGYRSGRRPDKFFATVEDCCKVTLYGVRGKGVSPLGTTHGCRLLRAARLDAQIWWLSKSPRLHLRCTCFEEKDSEPVELATTIPYFKGLRFWLVCPSCRRRVTKSGRSLQLNNWVRGGLRYVEKSGRRYFFEQDVIEYLWSGSLTDPPE